MYPLYPPSLGETEIPDLLFRQSLTDNVLILCLDEDDCLVIHSLFDEMGGCFQFLLFRLGFHQGHQWLHDGWHLEGEIEDLLSDLYQFHETVLKDIVELDVVAFGEQG